MRYLKIKDDLYLIQTEVKEEEKKEEIQLKTNHIFIIDRSGSMYYTLSGLIEDLIERSKNLPIGDSVTIGWFSTEGEYNWILKGFKITEDADYSILETILRKNNTTIGLTCFSEILADTKQVVTDLLPISDKFSLCFLSDGYPVVSNYQKEIDNIFKAINEIKGSITCTLMVGYGNYYNKELMNRMATAFGGSLTHSSDLANFKVSLCQFIENGRDSQGRIPFKVPHLILNEIIFSINGSDIIIYEKKENNISYLPTRKGKNWVYFLVNIPEMIIKLANYYSEKLEEITLTDSNVKASTSKLEHFIKGVYAASYIYSQKCQNDKALAVLGCLGDRYLIDKITNAFTNDEYGTAEGEIKGAITNVHKRFVKGRDTNYLPKENAFCLLDLFDLLCNDDSAYFYPLHPEFKYKKIGTPQITKEGYPSFEPDKNVSCRLSDLVWNNTLLNLSVLAKIPGIIRLKNGYKKLGLNKVFPTYVWRNFTIVKDGFLNVDVLPIRASQSTIEALEKEMDFTLRKIDNIYLLDLKSIPIINRTIPKLYNSATKLFDRCLRELELKAYIKTLKFLKSELEPEGQLPSTGFEGYNDNQIRYLMDLGVTKNGYSPPSEKLPSTDYYYAKEFKINIKGCSSLPKIEDVRKKIKDGKKLTLSDQLIREPLVLFDPKIKSLSSLEQNIKKYQRDLSSLRTQIQKTKFAVILGNAWFNEFPNRDECSMDVNGYNISIKVDKKKIEY